MEMMISVKYNIDYECFKFDITREYLKQAGLKEYKMKN